MILNRIEIPKIISLTEYELNKTEYIDEKITKREGKVFIFRKENNNTWHLTDLSVRFSKKNRNMLYLVYELTDDGFSVLIGNTFDIYNPNFNFKFLEDAENIKKIKERVEKIIKLSSAVSDGCSVVAYNINLDEENFHYIMNYLEHKEYEYRDKASFANELVWLPQKNISKGSYIKYMSPFLIAIGFYYAVMIGFESYNEERYERTTIAYNETENKRANLITQLKDKERALLVLIEREKVLTKEKEFHGREN